MTKQTVRSLLGENPVIAAVKNEKQLQEAVTSACHVVFLLFGDILHIADMVELVKASGKVAVVHLDLIDGLATRDISVEFIRSNTRTDGIISTKPAVIKKAAELGLITFQRSFIFDSLSLENMKKQAVATHADFWEVLPAAMPRILREIVHTVRVPIVAGGLIRDKEDVFAALKAGALAISSTSRDVWFM